MSEYVKIRKQILTDIADAIRHQKKTANLYKPSEFASVIRKLLCLPSAEAIGGTVALDFTWSSSSTGVLPIVPKASASSLLVANVSFASNASGMLVEEVLE